MSLKSGRNLPKERTVAHSSERLACQERPSSRCALAGTYQPRLECHQCQPNAGAKIGDHAGSAPFNCKSRLQAGIDAAVILLCLSHEQIETSHICLHADLQIKERALEKTAPIVTKLGRFVPNDKILPASKPVERAAT
jgi:hypothetical protein